VINYFLIFLFLLSIFSIQNTTFVSFINEVKGEKYAHFKGEVKALIEIKSNKNEVKEYFQKYNLELIKEKNNILYYKGKSDDFEMAFYNKIFLYKYKDKIYYAIDKIYLPYNIGIYIKNIILENYTHLFSSTLFLETDNFVTPNFILDYYNISKIYERDIDASNVTIGVLSYGSYFESDYNEFLNYFNLKKNEIIEIGIESAKNIKTIETTAIVEWLTALSKKSKILLSLFPDLSDIISMFYALEILIDRNDVDIILIPFIAPEDAWTITAINKYNELIERAVNKGITIIVPSGNRGSNVTKTNDLGVYFPSSNPNVLSVGGTSIVNGKETGWGGIEKNLTYGSGGGVSKIFKKPLWQSGLGIPEIENRLVPDISFHADPSFGYPVYFNGKWIYNLGGTMFSSLIATSIISLLVKSKAARLGNFNELIYNFSKDYESYNIMFNDIVNGTNGYYNSKKFWDFVTGLGSLNAFRIFAYISNLNLSLNIESNKKDVYVLINNITYNLPLNLNFKILDKISIEFPKEIIYKDKKLVFENITGYLNTTLNILNITIYDNIYLKTYYNLYYNLTIISYNNITKKWIKENHTEKVFSNNTYYLNEKERYNLIGYFIKRGNMNETVYVKRNSEGRLDLEIFMNSSTYLVFLYTKQYKIIIEGNVKIDYNITQSPTNDDWYDEFSNLTINFINKLNLTGYIYEFKEYIIDKEKYESNKVVLKVTKSYNITYIYNVFVRIEFVFLDLKNRTINPSQIFLNYNNSSIILNKTFTYFLANQSIILEKIVWNGFEMPIMYPIKTEKPSTFIIKLNIDDIELTIIDEKGNPIPNKKLTIYLNNGTILTIYTDERGKIKINQIPLGSFSIFIEEKEQFITVTEYIGNKTLTFTKEENKEIQNNTFIFYFLIILILLILILILLRIRKSA